MRNVSAPGPNRVYPAPGADCGPASAAGEAPLLRERRSEPRVAANAPARVFYGPGLALWADCTIKDRSRSGLKIQVPAIYKLPVDLVVLDFQEGFALEAEVRWRKAELAGLRLSQVHDLAQPLVPRLEQLRLAWEALGPTISGRS